MQLIVLSIHLVVSICLIGLVLLQRSEGGALGIGGGGGGALMSGRGASDALARMTSIAGALFLGVSLLLTWLSGAGQDAGRSVLDSAPAIQQPLTPAPAPTPEPARPDPTQSSLPGDATLASILPGPAPAAAAEAPSSARAAPLAQPPAAAPAPQAPARTTQAAAQGASAAAPPAALPAAVVAPPRSEPAPAADAGDVAISGVRFDEPSTPESVEIGGVEAVRRERAGPDQ